MSILSALDELKKVEKVKQNVIQAPKPKSSQPKIVQPIKPQLTAKQIADLQKQKQAKQADIENKVKKDNANKLYKANFGTPSTPYGTKGNLKDSKGKNLTRVVNPVAAGITKVASFGTSSLLPGMKEAEAQAQAQFPKSYIAGQVLGYVAPTGLATGLTKGLVKGATKKIGSDIGKRVVEGAIVGTAAEGTQIVKPLITKEITPEQAGKQLATGLVAGAGLDIGLGVLGKAFKSLPKSTATKIKSGATLSNTEKLNIVKELGLPEGTTADDYIRQMQDLAKSEDIINIPKQREANQVEQYYKSLEKETPTQQQIVKPIIEQEQSIYKQDFDIENNFLPEIYLHSTNKEFDEFMPSNDGFVYFSKDDKSGKTIADSIFAQNEILHPKAPKYRMIKSTLDTDKIKIFDPFDDQKAKKIAEEFGLPTDRSAVRWDEISRDFSERIKKEGYNVVQVLEPNGNISYAVSDTSIIKQIKNNVNNQITQSAEQPTTIVKPLIEPTVTPQIKTPEIEPQGVKNIAEYMDVPKTESLEVSLKTPSDKVANVLTDMPKKPTIPLKEKAARTYQMFVSSDLPLERIGRQNENVTNLASTLRNVGGSVDYNLETAMTDIEGKDVGRSLFSVFKDVPEENKKDLFEYSLHKHNIDRYNQGKPVFGDTIDANVSSQRLSELSTNPQLEEKSNEITKYMNGLMNNWALKSGLVNEDTLKTLNQMYPNYVPTYRNKDGARQIVGGSKGSVSNVIKKAKGGSSDILPLDQQMAMLTNKVIRASRKNELYNSLYDTFEKNPEFAERWFKPVTKEATDLVDGIDGIADTFEQPIKKVGDTYELNFFRNGEKVKAEISKDLYEAIKPLNELSNIEEVAAIVKKYGTNPFKSLITTYNPVFIVRNIMRDIPTAFLYSNDAVEWSKNMPKAFKEIVSNGSAWKEYRALGGARSGIFSYDKPTKIAFKGGKDNLVVKGAKGVMNGVATMNNITETLPRFAEYLATVKKGGGTYQSKLEGIMRASEITTDFGRGGKATKFADSFVPYLNPSVQGIDKFARQAIKHPLKTAVKGGLVISTPTLILDYINKDNRDYQELTEREKNQYFLIPKEDGTFIRIPKSREVGVVFSSMLDWILRRSRGEDVKPSEIASTIKENFTPVNMVENNLVAPLYKAIQQIKDPSRDVKNYAGISIIPSALKKYEPKEQYDAYTSEVAKQIGQVAGISPKVVDYLMRSYSGILGQTLLPKTSATQRSLLESSFITDPAFKSGNVNKFYDELEKQTQELAKQKRIDEDKVDPKLKLKVKTLNAVSRDLSDLRKEQKSVDQSNMSEEEKKKKIRELQLEMNNITREALLKGGK